MKTDIRLRYSRKENDLEIVWDVGHENNAKYVLDLFNKEIQEELERRGYDLKTIKFSINKKKEKTIKVDGEYIDENLMYLNKHYNLNLRKGDRVLALDNEGEILGGTNYVYVKHKDGVKYYHPQDINELQNETEDKDGEI